MLTFIRYLFIYYLLTLAPDLILFYLYFFIDFELLPDDIQYFFIDIFLSTPPLGKNHTGERIIKPKITHPKYKYKIFTPYSPHPLNPSPPPCYNTPMKKKDITAPYTAPPPEDYSHLPPSERPNYTPPVDIASFNSLGDSSTRTDLEALMLKTFVSIMSDATSTSSNRLSAAKEIGELLGKYSKAPSAQTTNNTQVNIADNPEKAAHLLSSLKKARKVATASDSGTRPTAGGKGA